MKDGAVTRCRGLWTDKFTGTVILSEEQQDLQHDSRLKYDRMHSYWYKNKPRATPIILVPQPSDDPNDPLVRARIHIFIIIALLTYGVELATLETRHLPLDPFLPGRSSLHALLSTC